MQGVFAYIGTVGGRKMSVGFSGGYTFGFNGQYKDDEVYGEGNSYTAEFWQYDPRLGRRWNVDPKPIASESEYACFRNSPILHSDPKGDYPWPPFWLWKKASEGLKYISPISFSPNVTFGTHDIGVGATFSFGIPKLIPISYRYEIGATYYLKEDFTSSKGWESSSSHDVSALSGLVSWQRTDYKNKFGNNSGGTSQGVGTFTLGRPLFSLSTTNDVVFFGGDGGDRFKYGASLNLQMGALSFGGKLGTGDPGPSDIRNVKDIGNGAKYGTYLPVNGTNFDPDQYRMGVGYMGLGGLKIGLDSEKIRDLGQNKIIHDSNIIKSPYFRFLENRKDRLYLQYESK